MVKAWREEVHIPTYEIGKAEKNPIFLEKRVYQGSSGVVYPYPVVESIANEATDHIWKAIYLENEYIKVMILPELGGRIQMAYDKVARRHFVYYNSVIKPALVGLTGPWISGGIEFNWPQHHRPSTYLPIDSTIEELNDGSVTVWVSEVERMFHQKGMAGFTLRPGVAYLEIKGVIYNRTDLPQTFLWWANPAVRVDDNYRSVFPPDINAVFDHGKRAVSTFPIATGTYYKMDYSAGVDIACYKNIPVPTSYMGIGSKYDFEGGYETDTGAGMLHVASHHFSPGKKQWTWGNGDFGRAWDRNLTDHNGPYIELMAGVYTENQPDFTWLKPYEVKEFTQYFLPYREIGIVKNASKDLLLNIEPESERQVNLKIFATSTQEVEIVLSSYGSVIHRKKVQINPEAVFSESIGTLGYSFGSLELNIHRSGRLVLSWAPEPDEIKPIPTAAEPALLPEEIKTCEQLFLTAQHLEQYRHATYNPVDYYEEALRRDPLDLRCNNALGLWYLRKGRFDLAEKFLRKAVSVSQKRNLNPYDCEPIFNLGLALRYQGRNSEAYNYFYKSTWDSSFADAGYFSCAQISALEGRLEDALYEVERSLRHNLDNQKARALKVAVLHRLGRDEEALDFAKETLELDRFNFATAHVRQMITASAEDLSGLLGLLRDNPHNYDETAIEFCWSGFYNEAENLWALAVKAGATTPMTYYYLGWCQTQNPEHSPKTFVDSFKKASATCPDFCFPNRLEAILALEAALNVNPDDAYAHHYLGNLYYDKRQYALATSHWERAAKLAPEFPTVWRNLSLAYFNKQNDQGKAIDCLERAFRLDQNDSRVLMELDQLYKRLGRPHSQRLEFLQRYPQLIAQRDDLVLEEITLLNQLGRYKEAAQKLDAHIFHPWEGGEGKVSAQYQYSRVELAKEAISSGRFTKAVELLDQCLCYPQHLGEGRLQGTQENDFYYLLGLSYKALGQEEKSKECFQKATLGPTEPAAAMYYNDAKPDKIFYAGLAFRALGNEAKARAYFNRLVNYGSLHIFEKQKMDYFAVSLPDLLIWDGSLDRANRIHCLYMLSLGFAGLQDRKHSERYLTEASELDPNHQGIISFKTLITHVQIYR